MSRKEVKALRKEVEELRKEVGLLRQTVDRVDVAAYLDSLKGEPD